MLSIYSDSIEGQLYSKAFHMNKIYIYIYMCVCVCVIHEVGGLYWEKLCLRSWIMIKAYRPTLAGE